MQTCLPLQYVGLMRNKLTGLIGVTAILSTMTACSSQDIPPAHKGRMFDKTGALAFYSGGKGFEGAILGPGTYYTGVYPEIRMIECNQQAPKEGMTALTKDGVQFSLDVYVTYRANCDIGEAVISLLEKLSPEGQKPAEGTQSSADSRLTISADQIYRVFIRPLIGEAVRVAVAPFNANDINAHRDEIFDKVKKSFMDAIANQQGKDDAGKARPQLVIIDGLTLNNLDFPDSMDKANAERATVAIERDKSLAEQEKIKAQIETAKLEVTRQEVASQATAKKIDIEGAALSRNPEWYLRDVYYWAAQGGSSVMVPSDPRIILQMTPKKK